MMKEFVEKMGYTNGFVECVKICLIDNPTEGLDLFAMLMDV